MISKSYYIKQKYVHFKAYQYLWQLEKVLQHIINRTDLQLQISILGKVSQYNSDQENTITNKNTINTYWKRLLGGTANFGCFNNPEIGNVFIAGPLASTFLHEINGKSLATLSAGPYAIFRGLGVSEIQASTYLKMLNNNSYLLILRGYDNELYELDTILNRPI
ncbi:hypothetical protein GCM10023314_19510 [Algibacter agarivorans]|uniref:Uncharacterized protein n=1 Tax=Algibacter agarivorans TaxID=1109741 RepID=A0ABP9GNS8_9FLAO